MYYFLLLRNKSPQLSGLKQQPLVRVSVIQKSGYRVTRFSAQGLIGLISRCQPGLNSHLGFNLLPSLQVLAEFISLWIQNWSPYFHPSWHSGTTVRYCTQFFFSCSPHQPASALIGISLHVCLFLPSQPEQVSLTSSFTTNQRKPCLLKGPVPLSLKTSLKVNWLDTLIGPAKSLFWSTSICVWSNN